jgi:hypothetical protein
MITSSIDGYAPFSALRCSYCDPPSTLNDVDELVSEKKSMLVLVIVTCPCNLPIAPSMIHLAVFGIPFKGKNNLVFFFVGSDSGHLDLESEEVWV